MLKRFSSLILVLLLSGSTLAATAMRQGEHVCEVAGMDVGHGIEGTSCLKEHKELITSGNSSRSVQCCFTIPQETGSPGTAFKLDAPSLSVAVTDRAAGHSLLPVLRPYHPFQSQVLPDLQHSYIRNLSLLI